MTDPIERSATSASRRSRPKSHSGCKTCKSRKIKCDERKPACGNCTKRNVECDFVASGPRCPPSRTSAFPDLNLEDLELLHNYTTRTCTTLSNSSVLRDFYRMTAVQLGLQCDYIMRALLAVSSLQLAYYRPHAREHYQSLAMQHHQIASRAAIDLIEGASASTADNLFLFSVLTIFYTLGNRRRDNSILPVGESGFPNWMVLLRGTRALTAIMPTQADGPLTPLFKYGQDRWQMRETCRQPASPVYQHLDRMRALITHRETNEDHCRIYTKAIEGLHKSFLLCDSESGHSYDVTDVFLWAFEVVDDIVPLLSAPTQEAVAIFAFFCVLLKRLKSQWWLHGWVDHLIAWSCALLDREHRLWIQWPLEEIGYVS
ncbi:hypothetical protein F5Y19DRAFT_457260 [Xylariaceae sp. FL1651]|nr:hypothetical protein F5Y19DRAFT_457260 [Xylariaceae sp. FL1651]